MIDMDQPTMKGKKEKVIISAPWDQPFRSKSVQTLFHIVLHKLKQILV